jgi:large subunit ribosomal protein L15
VKLLELAPAPGSRTAKKRIGRGISAGQGKTSGRGQKGQGSRSSVGLPVGFEGGQMPLTQRLPKLRGFHNKWRREYVEINVGKLTRFDKDTVVDPDALAAAGLIHRATVRVKVLAAGALRAPLQLRVHRISEAARRKVEAAGGSVELLEAPRPVAVPGERTEKRRRARRVAADDADTESTAPAEPAAAAQESPEAAEESPEAAEDSE